MGEHEKEVLDSIQRKLARVELQLGQQFKAFATLWRMEKEIMATLTDLQKKAGDQGVALDALGTAIAGIKTGVTGGLSEADQSIVDSTAAELTNNDAKIAAAQAAVNALLPPPPPPPPSPPPAPVVPKA